MTALITCVDELKARLQYRESLDFGEDSGRELLDILGEYSFPDTKMIQCGIKGCRTPHMHGYLVLTTDGLETNVGNVCGKKHLGDNFNEKRAGFKRKQTETRNLYVISELKKKISLMRSVLDDLLSRSTYIVKLKMVLNQESSELVKHIVERAKLAKPAVEKAVPMTPAEAKRQYSLEVDEDDNGKAEPFEKWFARRAPMKTVLVANLKGLLFWRFDLHQVFRQDILNFVSALDKLSEEDLAMLTAPQQRKFSKWGQSLDRKVSDVTEIVRAGEEFFTFGNVENLRHLESYLDYNSRPKVRVALDKLKSTIEPVA
ncbi:hypothetical protein [Pseudomonas putida]|uniref:hypothetical protein n=1 Tax=Pseudomonas putida TaxID=303 RepID=UPI002363540A|nr:hypothetical protein [Pseudomonas putida]MDD2145229.1 hypothetical protein [Pseudomonas putida]HDS1708403.1 hypothetical protein [Pseudomonas putida]